MLLSGGMGVSFRAFPGVITLFTVDCGAGRPAIAVQRTQRTKICTFPAQTPIPSRIGPFAQARAAHVAQGLLRLGMVLDVPVLLPEHAARRLGRARRRPQPLAT